MNKEYNNLEYVQRIDKRFVGENCVHLMMPFHNSFTLILNYDGSKYFYKPNSTNFYNASNLDKRKEQFPYWDIKFKNVEHVNQILEFNKVYIQYTNKMLIEYYVVKDKDEALLATKVLFTGAKEKKYFTRLELQEFLDKANGRIMYETQNYTKNYTLPTEEFLLKTYMNWYRKKLKKDGKYTNNSHQIIEKLSLKDYFDLLSKNNILSEIPFAKSCFIFNKDDDIEKLLSISISLCEQNKYEVKINYIPVTHYTLEQMKELEKVSNKKVISLDTFEPVKKKILLPNKKR